MEIKHYTGSEQQRQLPDCKDVQDNRTLTFEPRHEKTGLRVFRVIQPQKMVTDLKLRINEEEGLYYLCSENKGADQHRGDRETDLHLCFRICKKSVFSCRGSFNIKQSFKDVQKALAQIFLKSSAYKNKNSAEVDIAPAFGEITTACNVGQWSVK